ncbi:hypothetical protein L2E82_10216 [Cichorium intybus]|uniref:Uncharacterized protein n=1 Tax=Cichorium intybus TaxID=13427 RepID=A0ACB9GB18_CICIN|nr:hypothetical protein L2E82_10216 [Cichorium intybus]
MEKVKIRSSKGQAKVLGTFMCMAGTLTIAFWRGGFQLKGLTNKPLIDIYNLKYSHSHKENWVKGAFLISASKISWSMWLIFQGLVHKMYPAPLSMNIMICLFASLQSSILTIFFARDANLWKLEWDVKLLTILYGGFVVSGLTYYLLLWSISKRGPVFVAMFSPLQLPIVATFSAIVFNERLHVGSLVGALIIIIGLYCVLWGKSKDELLKLHENTNNVEREDKALQIVANDAIMNNSNKTES